MLTFITETTSAQSAPYNLLEFGNGEQLKTTQGGERETKSLRRQTTDNTYADTHKMDIQLVENEAYGKIGKRVEETAENNLDYDEVADSGYIVPDLWDSDAPAQPPNLVNQKYNNVWLFQLHITVNRMYMYTYMYVLWIMSEIHKGFHYLEVHWLPG